MRRFNRICRVITRICAALFDCAVMCCLHVLNIFKSWQLFLKDCKVKHPKKGKKLRSAAITCFVVLLIFSFTVPITNLINKPVPPSSETQDVDLVVETGQYSLEFKNILNELPFSQEVSIINTITWDELLTAAFHYDIYKICMDSEEDPSNMLYFYHKTIVKEPVAPAMGLTELQLFLEPYIGSAFMPDTGLSFPEIDAMLPDTEEERDCALPSVYINEFTYRSQRGTDKASYDMMFHTGRSAGDSTIRLIQVGDANPESISFYGSMSVIFYEHSFAKFVPNSSTTKCNIAYNIAELYMYVGNNKEFCSTYDGWKLHCLLSAQANFYKAVCYWEELQNAQEQDVFKKYPQLKNYWDEIEYALLLYNFSLEDIHKTYPKMYPELYS